MNYKIEKDRVVFLEERGVTVLYKEMLQRLLNEINAWRSPPTFKVGDFVRVVLALCENDKSFVGMAGKVLYINEHGEIGVEFAEKRENGWSLSGRTKDGHGCMFEATQLRAID